MGSSGSRSNSMGNRSGPNGGQAYGYGSSFKDENTTTKRDKINASGLDPRGMIVGKLDVEGEQKRGDVTIDKEFTVGAAIQELTEEVEKEPLPVEHKEHVRKYYNLLRGEGGQ